MRYLRLSTCLILVLFILGSWTTTALAGGLYVGHGRRSVDDDWAFRLNLSGGAHSASDPWDDLPSDSEFPIGAYGTAAIEFNVGNANSLELYASIRDIDDDERFVEVDAFGFTGDTGHYNYSLESVSGGLTLRHRYPHHGGASYWGIGGGVIDADVAYLELVNDRVSEQFSGSDTAAEAHALLGWEGSLAPSLALGVELGYRHTWLDYEDLGDTGEFSGFFGGLRLGLIFGP